MNNSATCETVSSSLGFKQTDTSSYCFLRNGAPVVEELMAFCCRTAPVTTNPDYCHRLECRLDQPQQKEWTACMANLLPIGGCQFHAENKNTTSAPTSPTSKSSSPVSSPGVSRIGVLLSLLALSGFALGERMDNGRIEHFKRDEANCTAIVNVGDLRRVVRESIRYTETATCGSTSTDSCKLGYKLGPSYTLLPGTTGYISYLPFFDCQKQRQTCNGQEVNSEKCWPYIAGARAVQGEFRLTITDPKTGA